MPRLNVSRKRKEKCLQREDDGAKVKRALKWKGGSQQRKKLVGESTPWTYTDKVAPI